VRQVRSQRETVPGNLIWHDGVFISQGPSSLEVFDEQEPLEQRVRKKLREQPRDHEALIRLGELELSAGRLEEGLARFREAHAVAPSARTRNRLVAALLESVRGNPPNRHELSEELDRLIAP
jgi:uncharacterized protein HemY